MTIKLLLIINLLVVFTTELFGAMPEPSVPIAVSDDSLMMIYLASAIDLPLYIPEKELIDSSGKPIDLKELFEKNNICLTRFVKWDSEKWTKATETLTERAKKNKTGNMISLNQLSRLLTDLRTIVKSFLLKDDTELRHIEQNFIKKPGFRRILTYARLDRVIKEKKLTRVRLPRKIVVVRDRATGKYISSKEAPKIIDTILKFCFNPHGAKFEIEPDFTRYELIVFADRQQKQGEGLSKKALEELFTLCRAVPFDIGYDNIFWDYKGNAIIIDTEYKGESPIECEKLYRYPIDHSL